MHAFSWYALLVNDPSGKAGKPWPPPDQRIRPTQATTQRKNWTPRKPLRETPATSAWPTSQQHRRSSKWGWCADRSAQTVRIRGKPM